MRSETSVYAPLSLTLPSPCVTFSGCLLRMALMPIIAKTLGEGNVSTPFSLHQQREGLGMREDRRMRSYFCVIPATNPFKSNVSSSSRSTTCETFRLEAISCLKRGTVSVSLRMIAPTTTPSRMTTFL